MPMIQMLCGCGWGNLCYTVEAGDLPVCPVCGYEPGERFHRRILFPEVETDEYGEEV